MGSQPADRPPAEARSYLRSNRELWEAWTPIHERSDFYDLPGFVTEMRQGRDRLRPVEVEEVGDVAGKSLLHLMCHLGTDTLSWASRGAAVTGVDFSRDARMVSGGSQNRSPSACRCRSR